METWRASMRRKLNQAESSVVEHNEKRGELHAITFYHWTLANDREQSVQVSNETVHRWLARNGHAIEVRQLVQSQSYVPSQGHRDGKTQVSITVLYERKPGYTWGQGS